MKKKSIFAILFCLIISVCVLFTGCGETDLSDINAKIETMQQQITDLQNRLNEAEENQQDLLLDLTTANGKLATLEEQVFGKVNNYYKLNEALTFSINGTKLVEFTPTSTTITTSYLVYYKTTYYDNGFDLSNDISKLSAYFYDKSSQKTYQTFNINENRIAFSSNIPNGTKSGLIYLYINNNIWGIYELNFDGEYVS